MLEYFEFSQDLLNLQPLFLDKFYQLDGRPRILLGCCLRIHGFEVKGGVLDGLGLRVNIADFALMGDV